MITAKLVRIPGAVVEVVLDDGATIQDALDAAGIGSIASNEGLSMNGNKVETTALVADGARICLAKEAKSAIHTR
jgi:hypothetical protein